MTMKKLVLSTLALAAGTILSFGQGAIILYTTSPLVTTNNLGHTGAAVGTGTYSFEVLDMTSTAYAALTGNQQTGIYSLISNPSDVALWTDTGVSGASFSALHAGGINAASAGVTAANWAQPTPNTSYSTATSYDYYTIIGYSASLGNWSTVSGLLSAGTVPASVLFGQTSVAFNYAGVLGGSPGPVTLWAASSATQLAGSGGLTGLTLMTVPEPGTLALAGLGGLAMLLIRRRK